MRNTGGANSLNISAFGSNGDHVPKDATKRGRDEVEKCDDRYYTSEEYSKLTKGQKYGLKLARKAKGPYQGDGGC